MGMKGDADLKESRSKLLHKFSKERTNRKDVPLGPITELTVSDYSCRSIFPEKDGGRQRPGLDTEIMYTPDIPIFIPENYLWLRETFIIGTLSWSPHTDQSARRRIVRLIPQSQQAKRI
jgi:hypothetical protein